MKKIIALALMIVTIAVQWQGCTKPEKTGTIYGTVTDQATGEPVKSAGVELLPIGLKTVTGSDGTFQFPNVEYGEYELYVTKTGYDPTKKSGIQLKGTSAQYDVQIAKLSAALRIVDDNGNDIDHLDFGYEADDLSRLFNIFNDSDITLTWQITTTANWISVSEESGTLLAGKTKGIIVVINRDNLQQGENTTTLHITSDNGNKQLTIRAVGGVVATSSATSITEYSAVLHGVIIQNVPYTEKGFIYGANHNLNHNISVGGNGVGEFTQQVSVDATSSWYYKTYCVWNGTTYYGLEKSFGPYYNDIPYFQYNGHLYMVAPDPGYSMRWSDANDYCEGLTLYGHSDWYMPTKAELLQMYTDRYSIGGFDLEVSYWSSSAWYHNEYSFIDFRDGRVCEWHYNDIGEKHHVRPIRMCD